MKLLCLECNGGVLWWDIPIIDPLNKDMTCDSCGFVYEGMSDYTRQRERKDVIENTPELSEFDMG